MNAPTAPKEANTYTVILLAEGSDADVTLYSTMLIAADPTEAAHAAATMLEKEWGGARATILDVIVLLGSFNDLVKNAQDLCAELNA